MPRGRKKVVEQAVAIFDGTEGVSTELVEEVAAPVIKKEPVDKKPARKGGKPRKATIKESPAIVDESLSQEAVVEAIVTEERAEKPRKAYPSHDERIALADKQIARLSKLNAEREAVIKATEEKLAVRKEALEKSYEAVKHVMAKKEYLIAAKEKAAMTAVERAAHKAEEKMKMSKLMEALKAKGKSLDELLEELTHKDE